MNELDKIALEIIQILSKVSTEEFYTKKYIILAVVATCGDNVCNFMRTVFELAEKKRPLLLEMKEGAI